MTDQPVKPKPTGFKGLSMTPRSQEGAGAIDNKASKPKPKPLGFKFVTPVKTPTTPTTELSSPFSKELEIIIPQYTGKLKLFTGHEQPLKETDLDYCGQIGGGVSGTVYKVLHKPTGILMAAKKMKWLANLSEQRRVVMDLKIMATHHSPHIVFYHGSIVARSEVWIYMELMDTCLDKLLKNYGRFPEEIVGKIVVSTLNALHYLKSEHDTIHRDVKPSNILMNKNGEIKMCDFGISGELVESYVKTMGAGPTGYISPERFNNTTDKYDIRADVWSLGISVVEMLTGVFPYATCNSDFEVISRIVKDDPPSLPSDLEVSEECREFVKICLIKDFNKRPKFKEILDTSEFVKIYAKREVDVARWYNTLGKTKIDEQEVEIK